LCVGNLACFETAVERSSFGRALHAEVSPDAINGLRDRLAEFGADQTKPPETTIGGR